MPFRIKLRRTRRYNVLSKNCFVTRIRLLDSNVIECTLSVESTGQECLEAVAQRLELRETHYFGLWFHSKTQLQRWVELEKALKKQLDKFGNEPLLFFGVMFYVPNVSRLEQEVTSKTQLQRWVELEKALKKQLDKFGNEPLLFFGVMFYVPNVSRLEQEVTRYQYYLQVKKEILDGRLPFSVEQGIRLAGLAVQVYTLTFTRRYAHIITSSYNTKWTQDEDVLEDLTQKVAREHKSHCGMPPAEAELLYIKEVEQLEGFGQESFSAKDNLANDIDLAVSFMGVSVKHRNGRSTSTYRWNDLGNITHNKSAISIELTNKEETTPFHTDDMEMAKYISRLFTARHKFYKQNKICTDIFLQPRPFILPPMHTQYGEHYQETRTSQDSIFLDERSYYRSQTSLEGCPVDYYTVPNGSVYSAPSMNSLNHSQSFIQASPMSSNLSIPGCDIMRPDYIPSHRHSAIIVPSYRPTPDYETVVRHQRGIHIDCQSQSLRNLNIRNSYAYGQPEGMVYSQPEIRERAQYPYPCGPPVDYNKPVVPSAQMNPNSSAQSHAAASAISHTVSTPELANTQQQGTQGYNTAHMLRNHFSRPPPPYPRFRPATSTPDLASHRHKPVSGSSPEPVTRKVQLSVKTFQQGSSPVVHQPQQEVSEPLTAVKHRPLVNKRHSLEVMSCMVRGMEAVTLKTLNAPLPRRNTLREQVQPEEPVQKVQEVKQPPQYQHKKTLSNATMLIHSSDSEEEEETPDYDVQIPGLNEDISAQLQAALAKIPNKPPPEYPGPRKTVSNGTLRQDQLNQVSEEATRARMMRVGQSQVSSLSRTEQVTLNGPSLGPSISEPDLTSVKERVKKEPVKERPVSELFSIEDSIVEREIMQRNLEKQKVDSLKRPLMMAALNGLCVARLPVPEDNQEDTSKVTTDERCKILERKLEEEMVFTEYEQIPKKKADGVFTTAVMPDNAERNRFRDIVPYEENRVELVPTKENNTGYINASHIKCKILERKLEEEMVFTEYEQIPKKKADGVFTTAVMPDNAERNRFRDIVPYEENRVELVPTKENNTGYINASHIKVNIHSEEWHYIATQGPLPNTCQDFWQMVWEQGVNVIAMVTAEEEGGRPKSHRYWPKLGSKHNSATHGKFKVTTKFRRDSGCYATTGLKVKHLLSGQERTVWHLQYTDWPDHGCPEEVAGFLSYLEEIQSVRRHTNSMLDPSNSNNPPIVVHCSAGVGRTGVVILTELMIGCLEHNEKVDVPMMLRYLRQKRILLVKTIAQYKFVYQVLIQFLKNSRLI
ncbi:Tyrosine-protein phosphatase non-receptor type 14 [Acipenser ruthenus]|uniref:protein-tyrosine-phosphatase n=1 Tax=Acipenser ruthenus TaxID=7906 RepID=A0A662YTS1_ACIRT|nr:Tyrosine-protein phosphatase non-receptor type 14 [Acipenser ruthenus]